eukprot:767849-Hanusia_phi.AAC.1
MIRKQEGRRCPETPARQLVRQTTRPDHGATQPTTSHGKGTRREGGRRREGMEVEGRVEEGGKSWWLSRGRRRHGEGER